MAGDLPHVGGSFPTTQWTQVERAGRQRPQDSSLALEQLLMQYAPVLRLHLLRRGIPDAEVDDVLHDFIADKVLEQNLLARADRNRGRFRHFLCSALNHYAANRVRDRYTQKRSPGQIRSLDELGSQAHPDNRASGDAFDIDWAQRLLQSALQRMLAQCQATGREDIWIVFDCRIRAPLMEDAPIVPYERLVQQLSLRTPLEAANLLVTAKRMFQRVLREVILEYTGDPDAVEAELRDLLDILSSARAAP